MVLIISQLGAASVPARRSFVRSRRSYRLLTVNSSKCAIPPYAAVTILSYTTVTLFSGTCCQADPEVRQLASSIGFACRAF
jgi:hypothetical protein